MLCFFCCIHPVILILALMARYISIKLLLILTERRESRFKPFVLTIPADTASREKVSVLCVSVTDCIPRALCSVGVCACWRQEVWGHGGLGIHC